MGIPTFLPKRLSLQLLPDSKVGKGKLLSLLALAAFGFCLPVPLRPRGHWVELNIGPFRVDTDGALTHARKVLSNLEQLRWVLGGILEDKNLEATWPFRVLISAVVPGGTSFKLAHGEYVLTIPPAAQPSLAEVAQLFIEANTPRLPEAVDKNFPRLFENLEANGSHVTWAQKPQKPDFDWARLQLFATKPAYAGRFPVFMNNLRGGSLLLVAEANAFGKDSKTLEEEVKTYFLNGPIPEITISGRPLDPKHDFGEHTLDEALAKVYLADSALDTNKQLAEQSYKSAGSAGYSALAQEGIALVVMAEAGNPREYLDGAIAAGTKDAWVYVKAAETRPPTEAEGLLKAARQMNPRWWVPSAKLAELAEKPAEKEALLKEACQKNSRSASLWEELARVQSREGKGLVAQNSWIRAEDAASSPKEREQIHQHREAMESDRLDSEEAAKKQAATDALAEETRLRNEQLDRIHAAEQRANSASASDQPESPAGVLPWWNKGEHATEATLLRVDCLDEKARLTLQTAAGKKLVLLVGDRSKVKMDGPRAELPCGAGTESQKVSLTYQPRVDKKTGTSGDVITLHFQ